MGVTTGVQREENSGHTRLSDVEVKIPPGHGRRHPLAQGSDSMLPPEKGGERQAVLGPELAGWLIPKGTGEPRFSTSLPSTCLFPAVFFF